ncbi:ATP-binding cassette domain-containing protein [candidate division KSB3 bacterium]|uniref:ATP-binding cassette domain-containing protein n=1 Tax=candidate division KSB3 bacterium TaxID=2044937 RepID=A0A9D5Q773_9BACT|nr:ATP-binding cassette domain-containing protein [candidate division KSB3 bacterium]MBD3326143.1 ATP-binding cassette domain-containing protein [candidate division KSB3 bacterium]
MRNITKQFPRVLANDNVTFLVKPAEIHALVGENGAGKSTLMNMLYGLLRPTSGTIAIHGTPVEFDSPGDAIAQGIGMVHQHFMLIPPLTVAENVILGHEPSRNGFVDIAQANKRVRALSEQYGLKVDPTVKVETLTVGIEQRVEIIKVLYRQAEILILDEPTAVLTPQEVDELFEILRSLKRQGKTIIIITHKLQEVMAISDNVTVMRRGKVVGSVATQKTSKSELATMMVGREVLLRVEREQARPGKEILSIQNLQALDNKQLPILHGISLTVRAGEILGLAGVEGNGQSELIEVLTGLRKAEAGQVLIEGADVTNRIPRLVREHGIGHIPEDRQRRGLILDYTVAQNTILGIHYRQPYVKRIGFFDIMNFASIGKNADRLVHEFDVRPPEPANLARNLSGGNQQKVIVAREFDQNPKLLIAAQPTRGIDVGSIEFIHRRLIEARDAAKAVLLVSADLEEILSLSDRIAVIYEGKIVGILDPDEATEERLGLMMTGGGN